MKAFKEALQLWSALTVSVYAREYAMARFYSKKINEFKKVHPIAEWFAKVLH